MSTRAHIIDGSKAESAKFGLVYTCKAGWIDLGHAGPGADMFLWPIIFDANRTTIGNNPNLIKPGQILSLPERNKFSATQLDEIRRRGRNWR